MKYRCIRFDILELLLCELALSFAQKKNPPYCADGIKHMEKYPVFPSSSLSYIVH